MPSGSSTSAGDARMLVASKRVVYVGGLADDVTQQVLRSAMIPFGNIKSLDIPMDYKIGKTRGFAFVEFDDPDDGTLRSIRFHTQYTVRLPLFLLLLLVVVPAVITQSYLFSVFSGSWHGIKLHSLRMHIQYGYE